MKRSKQVPYGTCRKQDIENFLENGRAFRDYEFQPASKWAKLSIPRSINLLNPTDAELDDALSVFVRDGYSTIVIYLGVTNAVS